MRNSEFITGNVPITKEEIRAISISKLNLAKAGVMIDIGSGTGSITVEAAFNYPNLKVIAIERDKDAIGFTKRNIEKFYLKNVVLLEGYAPINADTLECDLEVKKLFEEKGSVDSIFLGGTGGNLEDIIKWSDMILKKGGKLVANFIIVDTFNKALNLLKEYGFEEIETTVLNVSKLEKLGRGEYFKPQNPIYTISCEKGE